MRKKRQKTRRPKYRGPTNAANLHGYARRADSLRLLGFSSYAEYLQSDLWQSIRARVLRLANGICRNCGSGNPTQVHHRHYSIEVMSGHDISSLKATCRNCHQASEFDGDRKVRLGTANKRMADLETATRNKDIVRVVYIDRDREPPAPYNPADHHRKRYRPKRKR